MDAVLTAVLGAGPQLGGLVGLVVLAVMLIRREAQTTERHGTELDRLSRTHDGERAELLAEITRLRAQRDDAETQLRELWRAQLPPQLPPASRHARDVEP